MEPGARRPRDCSADTSSKNKDEAERCVAAGSTDASSNKDEAHGCRRAGREQDRGAPTSA